MREGDDSSEVKGEASGRPGFRDYLVLTGGVPGPGELYSPWAEQESGGGWAGGGSGSYFYNFQWETIDHILLSAAAFDGRGWEYGGFEVAAEPPFADASGYPHSYIPWTGDGLSDHLPVTARLEKRAAE
jgi:hypothetical protein